MPKIRLNGLTLCITLILSTYCSVGSLNAFVDHFFDFHLDLHKENQWRGQEEAERENSVWSEIGTYQQDKDYADRSSDRGTNSNTPDRD